MREGGALARPSVTRRDLLRWSSAAALAGALAACARVPASPREPEITSGVLPLYDDNRAVEPGLPVEEGATLRVFQWRDYLYDDVLERFAHRYQAHDIDVRVDSFTTMPEAVARLQEPGAPFDVFFPTIGALPRLVEARLVLPLTHEYLPNIRNLWQFFRRADGPFYDVGQRYTLPYTVYSTGIAWRADLVAPGDQPGSLPNPYDIFWNRRYRTHVGIYDSYREAIALSLLHRGSDPNTEDRAELHAAVDDLVAMERAVDVAVTTDGAYDALPAGTMAVQQAWSGDVLSAGRFGHAPRAESTAIRYLWPPQGVVGCDLSAICARARHPVLAHAFLDHLLDEDVALENFSWNGYQPPVGAATPQALAEPIPGRRDLVPASAAGALLAPGDLATGSFLRPLPPRADAAWRLEWQRFRGGPWRQARSPASAGSHLPEAS